MSFFENRIPPPVVFALVAGIMWAASFALPYMDFLGVARWPLATVFFLLALIGPFAIWGFSRARTTIDPVRIDRASTLVMSGAFSITRNPMYLSLACLLVSWAFYLSVPWLLLGPLLFALFINRFQIIPEERVLAAQFGDAYDAYRKRVRRWI